jgi:hypothetical protein
MSADGAPGSLSTGQMISELKRLGMPFEDCLEKGDLLARLVEAREGGRTTTETTPRNGGAHGFGRGIYSGGGGSRPSPANGQASALDIMMPGGGGGARRCGAAPIGGGAPPQPPWGGPPGGGHDHHPPPTAGFGNCYGQGCGIGSGGGGGELEFGPSMTSLGNGQISAGQLANQMQRPQGVGEPAWIERMDAQQSVRDQLQQYWNSQSHRSGTDRRKLEETTSKFLEQWGNNSQQLEFPEALPQPAEEANVKEAQKSVHRDVVLRGYSSSSFGTSSGASGGGSSNGGASGGSGSGASEEPDGDLQKPIQLSLKESRQQSIDLTGSDEDAPKPSKCPRPARNDENGLLIFASNPNSGWLPKVLGEALAVSLEWPASIATLDCTANALSEHLAKSQYDKFLYSGHAGLQGNGHEGSMIGLTYGGELSLPDESNVVQVLSSYRLKLVLLNGCKSLALGEKLKDNVQCVVCWRSDVHDEAAGIFARAFFRQLSREHTNYR